ncbi:CusA/CzcA family heavy metal efflux RND transporter [uncultured Pontibacter sp.]|uniref:CusA/CzcA family heavy metal efflux RND transporter n=1 Tax=uncultured Pontibacter sp. TaxID=453356 RepID=UPI002608118D|nr:CusA/CzcA family heavy metal efflux RND transporter [uncultured Pontibacter sp.]
MFQKIISFSIHNKLVVGLMVLALVVIGLYNLTKLPVDAVPDITNNQVQVVTSSPTLAAQEVERFITTPIEIALANVPDAIEMRSVSRFGLSVITVVFEDGVDIYLARQLIKERLDMAVEEIPAGVGTPEMAPVSTGLGEIYQYTIHAKEGSSKKYSAMELRTVQDWIVRRQLLGTPGVADVSSFGGFLKEYEVALNPDRLRSLNLTVPDVLEAISTNNENTGAAYIEKNNSAFFIRGLGMVNELADIEQIVISNQSGVPVLVTDVAEVKYGHPVRYGALTRNNEGEVVGGIVLMYKDANSSQVIKQVQKRVKEIQASLPEGLVIDAYLDRSELVDRAVNTVTKNLIEGGLIVVFVLVLLLGNLRAGLVVASVIPLSMLFAITMMNIFGVSGNLMSLGAIDFGLIVDGSVIIVESVLHFIVAKNTNLPLRKLSQREMDLEVEGAASKIMNSAAFGMIIILIVYLPILALVGIEGKMFKPMAQTVSFAIMGAFILSLTYVPMISTLALSKKTKHKRNISDRIMDKIMHLYQPVIRFALHSKMLILGFAIGLLAISLVIFSRMGGEFIPTLDEGDFAMDLRLVPGASLEQTINTTLKASEILKSRFPEVKEVIGKIGTAEIPTDPMPIEAADVMILLKDRDEWTSASTREELAAKMDSALQVIPGINYGFQQPIQLRFNELITGARQDVAVKIYGEDLEKLSELASEAERLIRPVQGAQDLYVEEVTGLPQIVVEYKRDRLAQYGLHVQDVNRVLRTAFAGETAGSVYEGDRRFDLVVRLEQNYRNNLSDIEELFVPLPNGGQVPLLQVANIRYEDGPMQISREEGRRRIVVGFNVRDRDVESIVLEVRQKLAERLELPAGYYITYGGQFENLVNARERLQIAVPAALLLILVLLYFTFKSVKQSLLIFSAIPLAAIGGIFALWLRGMPFSISAGVGFIALFGVAVLNGIVLIGYLNQLKQDGWDNVYERIIEGTTVRLRPVLMTASVAALGFLPMALSSSAGAEVQKPLATVVIGGLVTSTLLTLVVLPVLYFIFTSRDERKPQVSVVQNVVLIILSISLYFGSSLSTQAQQQTKQLDLKAALEYAKENNPTLRAALLETERQRMLQSAAFDLPKAVVNYRRGQISTNETDEEITVAQQFAFPTVYGRQARLAGAQASQAEISQRLVERQVLRDVKLAYGEWQHMQAVRLLVLAQDSLYENFEKAARVRQQAGETGALERATAEAKRLSMKAELVQVNADAAKAQTRLRQLLHAPEGTISFVVEPHQKYSAVILTDTAAAKVWLQMLQNEVEVAQAQTKLEKARLLPDFSIGYFNQTFVGESPARDPSHIYNSSDRFAGVEAGIAVPIWFGAQKAKINAAKLNEQAVQKQAEAREAIIRADLQSALYELKKQGQQLLYYEQGALRQAAQLEKAAALTFRLGEADYIEFVQAMQQAYTLRLQYLVTLLNYNQSIINLQYLTGEE